MKIHAFRLLPEQDLKQSIQNFVQTNAIKAGAIITCVGSLKRASLRMANQKEASIFNEKFEIVSLVGTLSHDGCHLHIALSDKNGKMTGGHLMEGCLVFTTAEIVIVEIPDLEFGRTNDALTGFKELVIQKRTT